jgi:hypothetical protein
MCANCVSKVDAIAATIGLTAYALKGPIQEGLVAAGLLPELHPLARDMRTVPFLRDLDLDPKAILGEDVVAAADRALAFPRQKIYRRSFREAIALLAGRSIRSQSTPAVQYTK